MNKQFSRGLQLGAAYTWSHAIDDSNDPLIPEAGAGSFPVDVAQSNVTSKGNSDNDIRQRRCRTSPTNCLSEEEELISAAESPEKRLNGIQLSGIVSTQTGHPYSIVTPLDNGRNGRRRILVPRCDWRSVRQLRPRHRCQRQCADRRIEQCSVQQHVPGTYRRCRAGTSFMVRTTPTQTCRW